MASKQTTSGPAVPGSVYDQYSLSEVLSMIESNEPMMEDSNDDLGLDIESGDEM